MAGKKKEEKKEGTEKRVQKCILCGQPIQEGEDVSTYRVEGQCKGFQCTIDIQKTFHNKCLTQDEGINEIARAQVLDYLEASEFNRSQIENLRNENMERAQKLLKEIEWRRRYEDQQS